MPSNHREQRIAPGQFLQTDPVGYEDDLNLYVYVRGDPLNQSDPTGKQSGRAPDDPVTNPGYRAEIERERALSDIPGANTVLQIGPAERAARAEQRAQRAEQNREAVNQAGREFLERRANRDPEAELAGDLASQFAGRGPRIGDVDLGLPRQVVVDEAVTEAYPLVKPAIHDAADRLAGAPARAEAYAEDLAAEADAWTKGRGPATPRVN